MRIESTNAGGAVDTAAINAAIEQYFIDNPGSGGTGEDGVSITSAYLDGNELVLEFSDSSSINVGSVIGNGVWGATVDDGELVLYLDDGTEVNAGLVTGDDGVGVPAGGATGEILSKNSAADYDTAWVAPPSGGGGGSAGLDTSRTGAIAETVPRNMASSAGTVSLTSNRIRGTAVYLTAGMVISSIEMLATANAGTPTTQQFALLDASYVPVAVTNNDGTTAWAQNTFKRLNLTSAYTVPADGMYYVAVHFVGGSASVAGMAGNAILLGDGTGQTRLAWGNNDASGFTIGVAVTSVGGFLAASIYASLY